MDPSPIASTPVFVRRGNDCSRISGLMLTSITRGRATMGYSRASSPLLYRAWCPRTFAGFANAGSTCSPSTQSARNRGDSPPSAWGAWLYRQAVRFISGAVLQHRPGHPRHLVRQRCGGDVRVRAL